MEESEEREGVKNGGIAGGRRRGWSGSGSE